MAYFEMYSSSSGLCSYALHQLGRYTPAASLIGNSAQTASSSPICSKVLRFQRLRQQFLCRLVGKAQLKGKVDGNLEAVLVIPVPPGGIIRGFLSR